MVRGPGVSVVATTRMCLVEPSGAPIALVNAVYMTTVDGCSIVASCAVTPFDLVHVLHYLSPVEQFWAEVQQPAF